MDSRVDHRGRILVFAIFAACLLSAPVFAQAAPAKSALASSQNEASPSQALEDHGLALTLGRATPEPDVGDLKACLSDHPPLACVPLTLTIKNQGKETIQSWSWNCGNRNVGFDSLKPDGNWEPFAKGNLLVCSTNGLTQKALAPGENYVLHLRLADPSLELDTANPPEDDRLHASTGYALLTGESPHTIRAHWNIHGCIASDKAQPESGPHPTLATSGCAGKGKTPLFVILQSNELKLESESAR